MVDSIITNDWFIMAEKDRRSARILFDADADGEMVCFHCQQAVEKALKGYLIKRTGKLQQGHNLLRLLQRAAQYDDELFRHAKNASYLNEYYVETRYPAEEPLIIRVEDVEECMRIMDDMLLALKRLNDGILPGAAD